MLTVQQAFNLCKSYQVMVISVNYQEVLYIMTVLTIAFPALVKGATGCLYLIPCKKCVCHLHVQLCTSTFYLITGRKLMWSEHTHILNL